MKETKKKKCVGKTAEEARGNNKEKSQMPRQIVAKCAIVKREMRTVKKKKREKRMRERERRAEAVAGKAK